MTKVSGYQPTAEQIAAQQARREAQQAAKAAKKAPTGGKTVFDKKQGKYVSIDVADVKAKKLAKTQQAAEQAATAKTTGGRTLFDKKKGKYISIDADVIKASKKAKLEKKAAEEAAKKASKVGGKTIFDEATGKWVSQNADGSITGLGGKVIEEGGKGTAETVQKTGIMSKIGKYAKKFGKIALIGAAVAAVVAGGVWLYKKVTGKKDEAPAEPTKTAATQPEQKTPEQQPDNKGAVQAEDPAKPGVTPTKPEEKEDQKVEKKPEDKKDEPVKEVPKDYEVKKGDCVWNIAKQHLKDLSGDPNYKPTNAEILKHTKELMELNQLVFEPDGYHVMIRPKQHLKLAA